MQTVDFLMPTIIEIEKLKKEKKLNEALELCNKTVIKNEDYRIYEEIADIYIVSQNLKAGLKAINYAMKLNPNSATWAYIKGFILLCLNKFSEAISFLEQSNKTIWNNSEVLRNLWYAYSMNWEYDRWIMILKRALSLSPEDDMIMKDLTVALIESWNEEEIKKILWK